MIFGLVSERVKEEVSRMKDTIDGNILISIRRSLEWSSRKVLLFQDLGVLHQSIHDGRRAVVFF